MSSYLVLWKRADGRREFVSLRTSSIISKGQELKSEERKTALLAALAAWLSSCQVVWRSEAQRAAQSFTPNTSQLRKETTKGRRGT